MKFSEQHLDNALNVVDSNLDESLTRLFALLRIPSISTDPTFGGECARAADLLSNELSSLGFASRVVSTDGHPIILAHYEGCGPHLLFYGHYDVQPVDPLNLWHRDPFEPAIETRPDGSKYITARGASDDKGQLRTFIEACRACLDVAGELPCQVTIVIEGEEESGSPSLEPFLRAHRDELSADLALICDTAMWDRDTPGITLALRGNAAGEVRIKGASRDLHSGLYGGPARNPIEVLTNVLAAVRDADGRVTLEGFYEGVISPPDDVRASWDGLDFDGEAFLRDVDLSSPAGEKGFSVLEQSWARPTVDINGIEGGYTGEGFKSVIPSEASAKISFRLVGDQDPQRVWASFEQHVQQMIPADCTASFIERGGSRAISLGSGSRHMKSVRQALESEWGKSPALLASGGSIPVVGSMRSILSLSSIMVGFALNDDNIHSPNEKYELKSFHKGIRSWVRILASLAAEAEPELSLALAQEGSGPQPNSGLSHKSLPSIERMSLAEGVSGSD